jgi:hypothetical protein
VISELLAYKLGKDRGREVERARQSRPDRGDQEQDVGVVEMICAAAIVASIVVVLIVALLSI